MRVDGPRLDLVRHVPHLGQNAIARHDRAAIAHEQPEQLEFFLCQLDLFAVAEDAKRSLVDLDLAVFVDARIFGDHARAAPNGGDSCDELANAERFRQVIVGAELEAGDAIALRSARGEHENRNGRRLRIAPQFAADRQAVEVGQIEIEDHEIGHAALHREQTVLPAVEMRDRVTLALEIQSDREGDVGVVFDECDFFHSAVAGVCLIILPSTR